jgi:hypothetical protein
MAEAMKTGDTWRINRNDKYLVTLHLDIRPGGTCI